MGKQTYMRLKGSQSFRQRLLLATLSSRSIIIEDIRDEDTLPGLHPYEVSFLRLLEKVCDDCVVEINETGMLFEVFITFSIVFLKMYVFYFAICFINISGMLY